MLISMKENSNDGLSHVVGHVVDRFVNRVENYGWDDLAEDLVCLVADYLEGVHLDVFHA